MISTSTTRPSRPSRPATTTAGTTTGATPAELESRGLGLTPRTTWRPVRVTAADWLMFAGVSAVVALVVSASAWLGHLEGPGALFA